MDKPATVLTSSRHRPILRIAQSAAEAWSGAMEDWFREAAAESWTQPLPSLVVVSTRAHGNALKARLLEQGISHAGLRFLTPGLLRDLLLRSRDETAPTREDLRLLLAVAAEETLASDVATAEEQQAAKAVLRAPDHLLRTLERIETAGWNFYQLRLPSFQPIVRRFSEQLHAAGLSLHAQLVRAAGVRAQDGAPLFSRVLVTGFDGAHWPHWSVLHAGVAAAQNATVLLQYPEADLDVDSSWIGSWEEVIGEATDVGARRSSSSDSFFSEEEMRGLGRSKRECTFLVGADTPEQAEAVAMQCVRFLAQPACTRIGVVFAAAGSLTRRVASALARLEIPHNDGIGHSVPGIFESAEWQAWLQLQSGPRINSLLRFINALRERDKLFPKLHMPRFERALRSAYAEVLIDDLDIIRQLCASGDGSTRDSIADVIGSIPFLPRRASMAEFLQATKHAFDALGWKTQWLEITRRLDERVTTLAAELSRALYLRWLGEVATTSARARDAAGEHPYARVQLLSVPEAHGQEWSHLIFAGWNEGSWPPPAAGEFVREDDIASFNTSIRQLNRRAAREGRQGEGHSVVREGHSLYLGPAEQRQIALRQF
ncbi:MAG TPA: hypothetical protein VK993_12035, partial [Chthoniobacterales bacterium]|nr:hypothetical protein [Chthoniobacterales bacterium]